MKTITFRFPKQDDAADFAEGIHTPCVIRGPWVDVQLDEEEDEENDREALRNIARGYSGVEVR